MFPSLPVIAHHLRRHVGAGVLCSIAYFDPGNWSVDIQAGTTFGYRPMLSVILISGIMAVLFQVLATRLGCVTGLDLAAHCRILLHDHPKYPCLVRFLVLYPLYILAELAIIATDVAELLGSAIGISLLAPALPIWACVLLTALDVFVFLLISDPTHAGRPVRLIEIVILLLVAAVFISFIVLLIDVHPDWSQAFLGFVPSKELFSTHPDAVYTAIGIVGATVMPHGLFLGSHLATQDRLSSGHSPYCLPTAIQHSSFLHILRRRCRSQFSITRTARNDLTDKPTRHGLRQNNSFSFVQAHLTHAIVDIVFSLLAIAVPINSAILILSATTSDDTSGRSSVGIPRMYDTVLNSLGKGPAFLFALALVFSGEAAGVTATFAGQVVSDGFIRWNLSLFLRRLITRLLGLIPSMIIAMTSGRAGLNTFLVASQVALSIVLPFVALPLIYLTSSRATMSVDTPEATPGIDVQPGQMTCIGPPGPILQEPSSTGTTLSEGSEVVPKDEVKTTAIDWPAATSNSKSSGDTVNFSNSFIVSAVSYLLWLVISVANVYGIVALGLQR